ncbi:MAG: HAD-IA family hydrolase [Oscillospiraceae bacterium]
MTENTQFDTFLFDLDGTLTNPYMGITNGILYALDKLGIAAPPREDLRSFIGPPLFDEFTRRFGMDAETANEAVRQYRVYYSETGLFENEPIDGASELLAELKRRGKRVCLATSKPEPFSVRILQHFGLIGYFDFVGASDIEGTRGTKAKVIEYVFEKTGLDRNSAVMVGDRFHDIVGAHTAGIPCIAVQVGFGSREEFERYNAEYIVETLNDVLKFS